MHDNEVIQGDKQKMTDYNYAHFVELSNGEKSEKVKIESDLTILELEEIIESESTIMEVD